MPPPVSLRGEFWRVARGFVTFAASAAGSVLGLRGAATRARAFTLPPVALRASRAIAVVGLAFAVFGLAVFAAGAFVSVPLATAPRAGAFALADFSLEGAALMGSSCKCT